MYGKISRTMQWVGRDLRRVGDRSSRRAPSQWRASIPPPLPRQPLPSPHRVGQLLRDGRGERRIIAVRFKPAYAKAEHEGRQRDRAEEGVEGGGVTSAPYPVILEPVG